MTPRPVAPFTMGANGRAKRPMKSVFASMASRSLGLAWSYLMRADWMMSATFTPEGQTTSQRLQFRQYLSAWLKKYGSLRRRRSPSGPACLGPG